MIINVYVSAEKHVLTSRGVEVLTVVVRRRTPADDALQSVVCVPDARSTLCLSGCCCCWRVTWLPWDKLPIDMNGCRVAERLDRASTHWPWDELSAAEWMSLRGDDEARCTSNTICFSESLCTNNYIHTTTLLYSKFLLLYSATYYRQSVMFSWPADCAWPEHIHEHEQTIQKFICSFCFN